MPIYCKKCGKLICNGTLCQACEIEERADGRDICFYTGENKHPIVYWFAGDEKIYECDLLEHRVSAKSFCYYVRNRNENFNT